MAPERSSPIEMANCGMPCRKFVVPSSGSTIQVWVAVGAFVLAAFLAEEAVARPRLGELGAKRFLGLAVGCGDEIARALQRDLEVFDLAEVALQCARGLARRSHHDVDEGGVLHQSARPREGNLVSGDDLLALRCR